MTAAKMLAAAREDLGLVGRPNHITREYAKRHGPEYLSAPWCDMSQTHWARKSGNAAAVLPRGDRAYTVAHAQDGFELGRWFAGTADNIRQHLKPGAIVFMAWEGTDNIADIDHVGVGEVNLGDGRVQTIEGNTGDACKRRVRGPSVIAGFWNPDYSKQEDDVSAKDVWNQELKVPFGSKDNPEWQAGNLLVNHGVWLRKVTGKVDALTAQVAAQNASIKALADALAQRDTAIDPDALVARIRQEIAQVTIHLSADPSGSSPAS